jgi:hypothetical protein
MWTKGLDDTNEKKVRIYALKVSDNNTESQNRVESSQGEEGIIGHSDTQGTGEERGSEFLV